MKLFLMSKLKSAAPTAYFIDLYSYGSHDDIVSEKAANGTALVQPVQPVSPYIDGQLR